MAGAYGSTTLVDRCVIYDTKFFYGGGWTAASLSRLAHCLPVISFPLINGVREWKLLRELKIQASAYTILQDKYSTTLLEELTS
jgi:hypothetical protein